MNVTSVYDTPTYGRHHVHQAAVIQPDGSLPFRAYSQTPTLVTSQGTWTVGSGVEGHVRCQFLQQAPTAVVTALSHPTGRGGIPTGRPPSSAGKNAQPTTAESSAPVMTSSPSFVTSSSTSSSHSPPPPALGSSSTSVPTAASSSAPPQEAGEELTYPCGICLKEVTDDDEAIYCEHGCEHWFHRMCTGLTQRAYDLLTAEHCAEWVCDACISQRSIPLEFTNPPSASTKA
eukprot:scpid87263/ scgid25271/ Pygopus homolog 1